MIPFETALSIALDNARRLPSEQVPLHEAAGRVLAVDVRADRDAPVRDLSAMDGIACRRADLTMQLTVIETIAAGHRPLKAVGAGQCSRIMTGAAVPDGADTVVMVEDITITGDRVTVNRPPTKSNIRRRGEEITAGATVAQSGTAVTPPVLAVLASAGGDPVTVSRRPRVAVIATGDELVEPSVTPQECQIRNTNSVQLCAQVTAAGGLPRYLGIAADTPEATEALLRRAIAENDVVLLSGGVSMGEFDFVPGVLAQAGVRILFHSVAIQPGKPTVFGTDGTRAFFGMPGNPVSTFVIFEMLVRPFLARMMGQSCAPRSVCAKTAEVFRRKAADRECFHPVILNADGTVSAVAYRGSAHIHAYTAANAMVRFPAGVIEIASGEEVPVILL